MTRLANRAPAAVSSNQPSFPIPAEQPSFGFEATRQNGDVILTWKRDSPIIRSATAGVISIQDGNTTREIQLLAEQVRGGSILYSPVSDQVQMQLRVSTPTANVTESVLVINPRVGPLKIQAVKYNTLAGQGDRPPGSSSGIATRREPLKTFTPPAVAAPARPPRAWFSMGPPRWL